MQYILVTGASGFVGSSLCEALLTQGYKVLGIGRKNPYNANLSPKERGFLSADTLAHKNFKYEQLELKNLDKDSLKNYEFSLAFHLASMVEYASLEYTEYTEYTINATINLIDFTITRHIPKIIFSSTASVFAQPDSKQNYIITERSPISPMSYYSLAKYTCEKLLEIATFKSNQLQAITLRFPALFGVNHLGGVVYEFAKNAWQNKDIVLFNNGQVLRNILYINDAIKALISAAQAQNLQQYEAFVIGSKDSLNTAFIAQQLIESLHSRSKLILSPKPSPNPFNAILDTTKAQQLLHFTPPSIQAGLESYAKDIILQGGIL